MELGLPQEQLFTRPHYRGLPPNPVLELSAKSRQDFQDVIGHANVQTLKRATDIQYGLNHGMKFPLEKAKKKLAQMKEENKFLWEWADSMGIESARTRLEKEVQDMLERFQAMVDEKEENEENQKTLAQIDYIFKQKNYEPSAAFEKAIKKYEHRPTDKNRDALIKMAATEVNDYQHTVILRAEEQADRKFDDMRDSTLNYYGDDIVAFFKNPEAVGYKEFKPYEKQILDAMYRKIEKYEMFRNPEEHAKFFEEHGFHRAAAPIRDYWKAPMTAFVDLC